MSDFGYIHHKTLALNKKKNDCFVATTSKLAISIQASIFCMSSEEGSNGYLPSHKLGSAVAQW